MLAKDAAIKRSLANAERNDKVPLPLEDSMSNDSEITAIENEEEMRDRDTPLDCVSQLDDVITYSDYYV